MNQKQKNKILGVIFVITGLIFCVLSVQLRLGELADMGPGFFPLTVSVCLLILGIALLIRAR